MQKKRKNNKQISKIKKTQKQNKREQKGKQKGKTKRGNNGKNGLVFILLPDFFRFEVLLFYFPCVFLFFVFFSTLKHIRISYRGGHNVRHFGDELHQDLGHWSTNCPTGQFFVPQNGQFRYLKFAIR